MRGKWRSAAAEGLFPDGTPFSIPETAAPPPPVPIAAGASGLAHLAVAVEQPGVATMDPSHAEPSGARYRGEIVQVRDTVRNGADPADVEVARLAVRLLAPGEATAGFVTLPVAQIEGLRADGSVAIPDGDLPPALTIAALPWYAGFLQGGGRPALTASPRRMARWCCGGAGRSIENLLILELANTARPRIAHLLAQNLIHPCALYRGSCGAGRADGDLRVLLAPVVGLAGLRSPWTCCRLWPTGRHPAQS